MKQPPLTSPSDPAAAKPRGFTLVEVMMAAAVGGLVLAAVASVLVMSLRLVNKNTQIDSAVTNTRTVQEHLNGEMAVAISQTSPVPIRPEFNISSGTTPPRYAEMKYRVPIGSYGTIQSDTGSGSNTITLVCPSDVTPKVGDYFLMDAPNLGRGIRITGVASGTGTATLTLASTLAAGTTGTAMDALAGKLGRIQRERKYETIDPVPSTNPVTELHWYETVQDTQYVTLSKNVDSRARYLFARVPDDVAALEPSVGWQFTYVSTGSNARSQGGDATFYQSNFAEGLIMPKSGDPLSATSFLGGGPTTLQSTTTLGTTTLGTSTSQSSTTTMGTSTSQSSTTTLGTSTSKTTTLGTSTSKTTTLGTSTSQTTTLGTSTSKTTTLGTSTSKTTTTLGTSTLGTSTSKTTTTLGTTTLGTSTSKTTTTFGTSTSKTTTTLGTTTIGTTTLGTSTSKTTTLGTSTSKSTTTLGTSTSQSTTTLGTSTSKTTTLGTSTSQSTTTLGTSTSKTTTLGTSTSQSSTSTMGTSTSKTTTLGTSTSKSTTTTTIPFDG